MAIPTHDLNAQQKKQTSIGYYATFIALGLITACLGPALPYLAEQTGTALSAISSLFISRSAGLILGSLLSGRLYDRLPGHPILVAGLGLLTLTSLLTPMPALLWVLLVITFLSGIGQSMLNVGGNTLLIWLHGAQVAPWMNGLHFFFGTGTILAPLLITSIITAGGGLTWAFAAISLFMLPPLVLMLRAPAVLPQPAGQNDNSQRLNVSGLVFLLALFFFCYAGVVQGYGSWIYTYALRMLDASTQTAGLLTSTFWGMFTLGRLLIIPFSARLRPQSILWGSLAGSLVSVVLLMLFPQTAVSIWLGTVLLGLSITPLFAATMAFAERRLCITGQINSLFSVGLSLGFVAMPWLVGQFFESAGPPVLLVILLITLLVGVVVLWALARIPPDSDRSRLALVDDCGKVKTS